MFLLGVICSTGTQNSMSSTANTEINESTMLSHKNNCIIGLDVNKCWAHAFTHTHSEAKETGSTFTDLTPKQTVSTRSTHSKLLNVAVLS